jgi:hypothetical protein
VSGLGKPLHLRLFLEGIEVPVVSAQVTSHLNGPAAAAIQVIPIDEVLQLKPRTMVHLFFLEKPPSLDPQTKKPENYRLLFAGETVGFAWIQKANMRSVVLQCLDFSSYWDAAVAASIDYGPQGDVFTNQAALVQGQVGVIDNIINFEPNKLVEWIRKTPETPGLQTISGLAGGAIRMLEALSGIRGKHRGINDFFTVAELRCRILAQICAEENDDTAYKLLKAKVFDEWVRQGLQNMGQQVTFRQMLQLLFKYIYYDFVPNPTAKYDPFVTGTSETKSNPTLLSNIFAVSTAMKLLSTVDAGITGKLSSSPEAARAEAGTWVKELERISAFLEERVGDSLTVQRALKKIDAAVALLRDIQRTGSKDNLLSIKEVGQAVAILRASDEKVSTTSVRSEATTARLKSHILRPDCWFAPPPRCNVFFPEHYTDFSYDRIFISEATRMLLMFNNTLVGQNVLLANKVLAPSIGTESKLILGAQANEGYRNLMKHELHTGIVARVEWVPNTAAPVSTKTEKQAANRIEGEKLTWAKRISLFNFFKERFASRQASLSGRFNPYVVCGFPGLIIKRPYMISRVTDDPMNRTDQDAVSMVQDPEFAQLVGAPSQLLGMIHSVTHTIGQDGGTTSLSMNYIREHMGIDDEFLGVFARTKETTTKRVRSVLRFDALFNNPDDMGMLIDCTPQANLPSKSPVSQKSVETSSVSYSTKSIDPDSGNANTSLKTRSVPRIREQPKLDDSSPYVTKGFVPGIDRELLVPVGAKLKIGSKGRFTKVVGVEVLDPSITILASDEFNGKKAFAAVAVYEDVVLPGPKTLAVEEIIRPDWFSPAYHNENISDEIYNPFFGTGSIIDDLQVTGLGDETLDTSAVTAEPDETKDLLLDRLAAVDDKKTGASIERAVNLLGYLYGIAKDQDLDIEEFISQYTHRPIAGLGDVLGANVSLVVSGTKAVASAEDVDQPFKVGFHTMAVHPATASKGGLIGLVDDPNIQLQRINRTGKSLRIIAGYDVRNEKWARVLAYYEAIRSSPGGFRG